MAASGRITSRGLLPLGFVLLLVLPSFIQLIQAGDVGMPHPSRSLLYCTFEEDCKLLSFKDTSDYKWRRLDRRTATWDTGPTEDHTTGKGFFWYTEASDGREGDTTELRTDALFASSGQACVSFWYHMNGEAIGKLRVVFDRSHTVLEKTGSQSTEWTRQTVALPTNDQDTFTVSFIATRGNGTRGDIAIDDLQIINGDCSLYKSAGTLFTCDFENACDRLVIQLDGDGFDWSRRQGSTPTDNTGPNGDHTIGSTNGMFMFSSSP